MRVGFCSALLLSCLVWATRAQSTNHTDGAPGSQQQKGIWDDPIRFNTKAKDPCRMVISGQGNFTKLRVTCKSKGKSYWCDFLGKPNLCKSYNRDPRHFFTQMMWDMRKLQNPCLGPRIYKPQMCRAAPDDVQMVFHASWPKVPAVKPTQASPNKPLSTAVSKAQTKSQHATKKASKPGKTKVKPFIPTKPTKTTTVRPTAVEESTASRMSKEYCWKSFHRICTFFISWFH